MSAPDVLEVVRLLERHGIPVWLDGGWGVDALLGEQRRPHKDLDMVLALGDVDAVLRLLGERGFVLIQGGAPMSFVLEDPRGTGVVGGQPVRCLTPEVQMLCHTGYAFDEKDVGEVLALHERFGVDIPEPYRDRVRKNG